VVAFDLVPHHICCLHQCKEGVQPPGLTLSSDRHLDRLAVPNTGDTIAALLNIYRLIQSGILCRALACAFDPLGLEGAGSRASLEALVILSVLLVEAVLVIHCLHEGTEAILGQRDTRKAIIVAAGRICRGPLALVAFTSLPLWANRGTVLPTVALPEGGVGASREVDLQAMVTRGVLDHVNQTDDRCCHGDGIHSHFLSSRVNRHVHGCGRAVAHARHTIRALQNDLGLVDGVVLAGALAIIIDALGLEGGAGTSLKALVVLGIHHVVTE